MHQLLNASYKYIMDNTRSFAAFYYNDDIRHASSSGGVFYALAERTLLQGGVVFGAAFDNEWQVQHCSCTSKETIFNLMQSKYVQSKMGDVFKEIKTHLTNGKRVLFCGTPCQVQGVISFLNASNVDNALIENLITIDFICHGVPSRLVWREYLKEITGGKNIKQISFRDKKYGWNKYCFKVDFEDGTYFEEQHKNNLFFKGFLQDLYLRPSCYECQFKGLNRISDFTLADFWGVQEIMPELFDDKGISIVITHSERALRILGEMKKTISIYEIDNSIVEKTNASACKSATKNRNREKMINAIKEGNVCRNIERYTRITLINRVKRKMKTMLKL